MRTVAAGFSGASFDSIITSESAVFSKGLATRSPRFQDTPDDKLKWTGSNFPNALKLGLLVALPQLNVNLAATEQELPLTGEIGHGSIANRIAHIRAELRLSVVDLAAVLRVERQTVYSWLRGDTFPTAANLERLEMVLNVTSEALPDGLNLARRAASIRVSGRSLIELLSQDVIDLVIVRNHIDELVEETGRALRSVRRNGSDSEGGANSRSNAVLTASRVIVLDPDDFGEERD